MKRRGFLGAVGTAGVILPGWIREAFAAERAARPGTVFDAWRRAARAGKPLLVFIIPADRRSKWSRGHAFGELLHHGGDEALACLALSEIVCATSAEIAELTRQPVAGEPLLVLVETDRLPARVVPFDASLDSEQRPPERPFDYERQMDAAVDEHIAVLSRLARQALAPDEATLHRRAAQARAALGPVAAEAIQGVLASGRVPAPAGLSAGAALVTEAAANARGRARKALISALAGTVQRLRDGPPPGARWASAGGCGVRVDGDDSAPGYACGMGHVPERSRRMLYFFANQRDEFGE